MTLQEKIDEMYRQLETTNPKSKQKMRDLKRGIEREKGDHYFGIEVTKTITL